MRTVAIYAFSPTTRGAIKDSKAKEVWTLNNAYKHDVPIKRITRWYDIHSDWYLNSILVKDEHRQWLKQKHSFELITADKYPLEEITAMLGYPYLTNSIAYMAAHAVFEGVDRLELYGVDMALGTEYAYQKAGTEFVLGFARGRGVDVYVPDNCALLHAPLYAYDQESSVMARNNKVI